MAQESQNVAQLRKQLKDAIATELQQRINAEYETIRKTYDKAMTGIIAKAVELSRL